MKTSPPKLKPMSFDARVEPIFHAVEEEKSALGRLGHWKARRRVGRLIKVVNERLESFPEVKEIGWHEAKGDRVCNLRLDRIGVLQDLRQYANELINPSQPDLLGADFTQVTFQHILRHRERNSLYLPVEFNSPFAVHLEGETEMIPVGSSVRLEQELEHMNRDLHVESSFKMAKMVDFMEAEEDKIAQFESRFDSTDRFWVKFGFVILRKLARTSVQHGLPIIFR